MVYKKYIKKDGKMYGPYYYHSRREGGKVVSEYHGIKKAEHNKYLWVILGIFLVAVLIYGLVNFGGDGISGRVVMDLGASYQEDQALEGNLKLLLKQGELLPGSSKLVFENAGQKYEYNLDQIVSDELTEGDFYISGKSFSGTGLGYGMQGVGEIYPTVYFTLNILSSSLESDTITEESTQEEQTSEENLTSPITGGVISGFFSKLNPTGKVTLEIENTVDAEVSVGNDFVLELLEGQSAEIVEGSVKTDTAELSDNIVNLDIDGNTLIVSTSYSEVKYGFGVDYLGNEEKILDIDLSGLDMVFEPGDLKVSLIYSNQEIISLTTMLGEEEVIAKGETPMEEPVQSQEPSAPQEPDTTPTTNITNATVQAPPKVQAILTEQEKTILEQEFGNVSVEVTKAEEKNNRLIVRYELQDYWFEATYDVALSGQELDMQMEIDKIKWLKDIAKSLSKEESPIEEVEELLGNYSV